MLSQVQLITESYKVYRVLWHIYCFHSCKSSSKKTLGLLPMFFDLPAISGTLEASSLVTCSPHLKACKETWLHVVSNWMNARSALTNAALDTGNFAAAVVYRSAVSAKTIISLDGCTDLRLSIAFLSRFEYGRGGTQFLART